MTVFPVIFLVILRFTFTLGSGTEYLYNYEARLEFWKGGSTFGGTERHTELLLQSQLKYSLLWSNKKESLARIRISGHRWTLSYNGQAISNKALEMAKTQPIHEAYIRIKNCKPHSILVQEGTSSFNIGLMSGMASIFQYQPEDWQGIEQDVLGNCSTQYMSDQHGLHKTKSNCSSIPDDRSKEIFGTTMESHYNGVYHFLPSVGHNDLFLCSNTAYEAIERVNVSHKIKNKINMLHQVGSVIHSRQSMVLKEQLDSELPLEGDDYESAIKKVTDQKLLEEPLHYNHQSQQQRLDGLGFKKLFTKHKKYLTSTKLATKASAKAFKIIRKAINQPSTVADFNGLLADKSNHAILPQLIEIYGSSRNLQAHQAALELFENPAMSKNLALCERYLWAIAQISSLPEDVSLHLLEIGESGVIKNAKLLETFTLTLGTLAKRSLSTKVSGQLLKYISENLSKCKNEECIITHLRAVRNSNNIKMSPILLQLVKVSSQNKKIAITAMKALFAFPVNQTFESMGSEKLTSQLLDLLTDKAHDSAVRGLAAEMLITHDANLIGEVLKVLHDSKKEFKKFMLSRVEDLAKRDSNIRQAMRKFTKEGKLNWNLAASGGVSISFSRQLISASGCNASFVFDLELAGSMLKRSNLDFFLSSGQVHQSMLQLDTFGGGMSEYVTPDPDEEKDEDAPHAGMQLTINGNQLRPFIFFKSSQELMSLYWSGQAEQKNSAIQGNMMLQDTSSVVTLSSGIPLEVTASGALSYDSSGQASVSIWTKTADTVVENSGALVLDSHEKLLFNPGVTLVHLSESFETEASLNVQTDIDFGGDGQMCIQMTQPRTIATIKRGLKVGSNKTQTSQMKQTFQARTIFLNSAISNLCNAMKKH